MNLNIQIPDNTAFIFEYMQKGQFICSNSTDIDLRDMYNMIDENYESLYQYFSQINYTLERGFLLLAHGIKNHIGTKDTPCLLLDRCT